jgi:hypothetical protein
MSVLAGRHVLIVEDDILIAMDLEEVLQEAGCASVSLAATVGDAVAQISSRRFDVALLDVTLHGSKVYPAADANATPAQMIGALGGVPRYDHQSPRPAPAAGWWPPFANRVRLRHPAQGDPASTRS